MELFITMFILLVIIVPIIIMTILKPSPTEGKKLYLEIVEKLKTDTEEKVKNHLKKQHNMSTFIASSLVSAARRQLNEHFELIFDNYKKTKNKE